MICIKMLNQFINRIQQLPLLQEVKYNQNTVWSLFEIFYNNLIQTHNLQTLINKIEHLS